jgi:hypothetical protein
MSNQGEGKKSAVYPCLAGRQVFFLDFSVLFYQEQSTEKNLLLKSKKNKEFVAWS